MDCNIEANPPIDDLVWLLNDLPLVANVSAGIIMSNQSLVLQRIRIEHRGQYQCVAHNLIGKSFSNKLDLRPKFEPICDYSLTKTKYEIPVNQPTRIECNVLAEPGEDLQFIWRFNQTYGQLAGGDLVADSYHLDDMKQYETNFTKSSVMFTPKTRRHYGQLLCSASNSMGKQERPCVIQVLPSELPDPVSGCFTDSQTHNSFSVHCRPPIATQSSSTSAGGRQIHYLLELYVNESSLSTDNNIPATAPTTHLRLRQPEPNNLTDHSNNADQDYNTDDDNHRDQSGQQQVRIRRLFSDSPSFNVADLKPNTNYNILVYVQNSKGRSVPAYHQASTKPHSQNVATGRFQDNGRVEFINKRPVDDPNSLTPSSLSSKLISYLRIDDYFGNFNHENSSKPMVGIALVVLLCAISIVTIVFFVNRLCRSTSLGGRKLKRRRPPGGGGSTSESTRGCKEIDSGTRTSSSKTTPTANRLSENHLATLRARAVAGSGSDTSRETNTDSTLISSPRNGTEIELSHNNNKDNQQQVAATRDAASYYGAKRCSTNDLAANSYISSSSLKRCANVPPQVDQKHQLANGLQPTYSSVNKHQSSNNNSTIHRHKHSNTPQVSLQSGSDCMSTNDVVLQAENSDHFVGHQDHLLIKCQDTNHGEQPVYMISRNELQANSNGSPPKYVVDPSQIRLVSPNHFWPYGDQVDRNNGGGSLSGGTQISSVTTADSLDRTVTTPSQVPVSNRCQVVAGDDSIAGMQQYQPNSLIPNSVSIPVSLNDRLHVITRGTTPQATGTVAIQRRLSQDYLQTREFCNQVNSGGGSYLALASSDHNPHIQFHPHQSGRFSYDHNCYGPTMSMVNYQRDCQNSDQQLSSPIDFAKDYHRFKENFSNHYDGYCTQTLDNTHIRMQFGGQCLAAEPIDIRPNSIDGTCANEHSIIIHQPQAQKHRVKFETSQTRSFDHSKEDLGTGSMLLHDKDDSSAC